MSFIRKATKLALIPTGIAVAVFQEVKEELREKTPEEMKAEAKDKYEATLEDIKQDEEIVRLEKKLAQKQGITDKMSKKERRIAELRELLGESEKEA